MIWVGNGFCWPYVCVYERKKNPRVCSSAIHCLVQFSESNCAIFFGFDSALCCASKSVCLMANMRFLRKLYDFFSYNSHLSYNHRCYCCCFYFWCPFDSFALHILCVYAILWMAAPCTSHCRRWTVNKSFAPEVYTKKKQQHTNTRANGKNLNIALKRTNNEFGNTMYGTMHTVNG